MTVGQLREQIAGVPGELEVEVFAGTAGEGVPVFRATRRTLPSAAFVLVPEEVEPHGGRPAGYIDPDESRNGYPGHCPECGLETMHDGHMPDCPVRV